MHDYHAVSVLVERLTSGRPVESITEVRIRADATFSPEALLQAYEMLTQDTPLEGSRLLVELRRDERKCPACGASWILTHDDVAGHLLVCPSCGTASAIEGGTGIEVVGLGRTARVP